MGKIEKTILEKDLVIIRKRLNSAEENNIDLYEYKFYMLNKKQKSEVGVDLIELSTGKKLKDVRNSNIPNLWRQGFNNFREYLDNDLLGYNHLRLLKDYCEHYKMTNHSLTPHITSNLITLEKMVNEQEKKVYEKEISKLNINKELSL